MATQESPDLYQVSSGVYEPVGLYNECFKVAHTHPKHSSTECRAPLNVIHQII